MSERAGDGGIAVYGASGHTGRFVVDEIGRRGLRAIRIGRDLGRLEATGDAGRHGRPRVAEADDGAALDAALAGAAAVINCAGPFFDTAAPLVEAALRAGIPYLDVAPEQVVVQSLFNAFDEPARAAGIPVLPAAAFYGGLADLLASALVDERDQIDSIVVAVGLDGWRPTPGTRLTGRRNTTPRFIQRRGRREQVASSPATGRWIFPEPIGQREVAVAPVSEIVTLGSHLKADTIESWMNVEPLRDLEDADTPPPEPSDELGRSSQRFAMDVVVSVAGEHRRASAVGRDIYFVSAPIVVEAASRLLANERRVTGGVHALGAAFDARAFLAAIGGPVMDVTYPIASDRIGVEAHHPPAREMASASG